LTELSRNFPLVFLRHRVYIAHPTSGGGTTFIPSSQCHLSLTGLRIAGAQISKH